MPWDCRMSLKGKHSSRDFEKMRLEPGKERKEDQELEGGYERSGTLSRGRGRERMPGTAEAASFQGAYSLHWKC